MKNSLITTVFICLTLTIVIHTAGARNTLVVGRVDDFEDGTVQGWSGGAHLENVAGGGPAGENDRYLEIRRPTPSQPYPFHLGTKNETNWSGNYLKAGVTAIRLDVKTDSIDVGPENLSLRIVLFGPGGAFSSREPVTVITEDGWQSVEFGLTRSDLERVFAAGSYADPGLEIDNLTETLRSVDILLIRHDPGLAPSLPGSHAGHIEATLGIDNITAVLGPAPAYDVAWTFDNTADGAYVLNYQEPANSLPGEVGVENPTFLLYPGERYQITVLDPASHPFELIAKGAEPAQDEVLLSAVDGVTGRSEDDPDVAWIDNGSGTVTFTLTDRLYRAMRAGGKRPGYRCGIHPSQMRGDFQVCIAPIAGDLNGDCRVDFQDLELLMQEWLDSSIEP